MYIITQVTAFCKPESVPFCGDYDDGFRGNALVVLFLLWGFPLGPSSELPVVPLGYYASSDTFSSDRRKIQKSRSVNGLSEEKVVNNSSSCALGVWV